MVSVTTLQEFFKSERGLRPEILSAFGVSFPDDQTALLPYPNGEKTRKHLADGSRRFYFTEGKRPWLFKHPDAATGALAKTVFLVEGETDTMRLWQELMDNENEAEVVGISGINCWRAEMAADPVLAAAERVLVVLDNDVDYNVAARVDAAWKDMRHDLGRKAQRVKLPGSVKDLCEFFRGYDLDALRALTVRTPTGSSRYRPLDLNMEPPPVDWLLDGLVARGDVTMLLGDGGLGKSWLTKGLSVAVALGHDSFLDRKVAHHGAVLYVDEENPEDVVRNRLRKLGVAHSHPNLRYLCNEGIRLDRGADEFLEEALDYEPQLIVIDSLTRIHTEDENSASAMAKLYNDGLKPLARETGAAVILIHHTNKGGGARGSVDLVNSMDAGLGVSSYSEGNSDGRIKVKLWRSRRRASGESFGVEITDLPDGSVELVPIPPPDPPF